MTAGKAPRRATAREAGTDARAEFDRAIRVRGSCPVCADRPVLVGTQDCPRCGKSPFGS